MGHEAFKIQLSFHSKERAKERMSWSSGKLRKEASQALNNGIIASDDPFLKEIYKRNLSCSNGVPYYYNGIIYVFVGSLLVTVYPLSTAGFGCS